MPSTLRSYLVNGQRLKELRAARGWTQAELSRRAGYTVRVIGKAEGGNSLDLDTISAIAQALSQSDGPVTAKQLMLDQKAIAAEFIEALDRHGPDMVNHIEHYLAPEFVWICPGDPAVAPFIGQWHGADGLRQFFAIYCGIFRRLPTSDLTFAVAENAVIVRYLETAYMGDQLCGPIRINMHFQFRDGLIVRIDDDYDTHGGAEAKRQAEEKLNKRSHSA